MRKLGLVCTAMALAIVTALPAHADTFTKLTYLTFSAPVDLPGMSLPAGKYRFELADPTTSRRVIKVSSEDGTKVYGMLLTIPNTMIQPAQDPVVMFQETEAGAPHAVRAWWYPGESIGYEFVYPRDQAVKLAQENHEPVAASDNANHVGHVAENGQFTELNNEGKADTAAQNNANQPTLANSGAVTTIDSSHRAQNNQPAVGTTARNSATTAPSTTSRSARANRSANANAAVGTTGQATTAQPQSNRQLPRTASSLPAIALFSIFSLAGGLGVRRVRRAIA